MVSLVLQNFNIRIWTHDNWHKVWLICVHSFEQTGHSKYALLTMSVDGPVQCKHTK